LHPRRRAWRRNLARQIGTFRAQGDDRQGYTVHPIALSVDATGVQTATTVRFRTSAGPSVNRLAEG